MNRNGRVVPWPWLKMQVKTVKKVPGRHLPVKSMIRLQCEISLLAMLEKSWGGVPQEILKKGLLAQIVSPPSHSQRSGPLTSWPGDLAEIRVCACVSVCVRERETSKGKELDFAEPRARCFPYPAQVQWPSSNAVNVTQCTECHPVQMSPVQ